LFAFRQSLTTDGGSCFQLVQHKDNPHAGRRTYKYQTLECKTHCNILTAGKFKMTFEPGHPDANPDGYVAYPDIDKNIEFLSLSSAAQILRAMALDARPGS